MKYWWLSLNERERRILTAAGVFLIGITFYLLALEPMYQSRSDAQAKLSSQQMALARIQSYASEAIELNARLQTAKTKSSSAGTSFLGVINSSAVKSGIRDKIKRISPEKENRAALVFDEIPFDNLIAWLLDLKNEHGIVATRTNIDATDTVGLVRASLTIER